MMRPEQSLRVLTEGPLPLVAPLVFDPITARLAQEAGFRACYLGGGTVGFAKCVTEANLNLTEMAQIGVDIRAACDLPLILDGAAGWGDPMHLHRTVQMAEAAGFCGIEIEDQVLPKRAHHHVGIEHAVPTDLMAHKVREAVAARRGPGFMVIARTNVARSEGLDAAVARAKAYRDAGADMLLVLPKSVAQVPEIGRRLGAPLMHLTPWGGVAGMPLSLQEMGALGFRLVVDPFTPFLAAFHALRQVYQAMAAGQPDPTLGPGDTLALQVQRQVHQAVGLEALLEVERRTVEPG